MKVNKKVGAVAGLGALALVGGTFAYYSQSAALDNPFHTGHYDNVLIENYTPPTDNIEAGAEITKEVGAVNTGTYPVLVRIKMDEVWSREGVPFKTLLTTRDYTATSNRFNPELTDEEKAAKAWKTEEIKNESGATIRDAFQNSATDGLVPDDPTTEGTVVYKKLTSDSKWVYRNDGYWYYQGVLEPGAGTGNLMDSLLVAADIDLGKYVGNYYYYIDNNNVATLATDGKVMVDGKELAEDQWVKYEVEWENDIVGGKIASMTVDGWTLVDHLEEGTNVTPKDIVVGNEDGKLDAIDLAKFLKEKGYMNEDGKLFRKNDSEIATDDDTKELLYGYADANYTLTITSEFIQATEAAVLDGWKLSKDDIATKADVTVKDDGDIVNKTAPAETEAPTEAPAQP